MEFIVIWCLMKKLWLGNFLKLVFYVGGNIFWSILNKGFIGNFFIIFVWLVKRKNYEFVKLNSLNILLFVIDLVDLFENMFSVLVFMVINIFYFKYEFLS